MVDRSPAPPREGPLAEVKVLDLSRILAGPYCSMMLADLGATVIKVEPPGGDDTRRFGPPFLGGESSYFLSINRGKRSICLDLKRPEGLAILMKLVQWADVLLENFRPGVTARLGIDAITLRREKPELIYASISGYGQTGDPDYSSLPGYDLVIQGVGGVAALTGPVASGPYKVGTSVADMVAGLNAFGAITSALVARGSSGEGQTIDISMLEGQLALLTYNASVWLNLGERPQRLGNAHPSICPYQVFEAADGHMTIACGNDGQFARLAQALGRPEWADEPCYLSNAMRVKNRAVLVPLIQEILRQETIEHWLTEIGAVAVPVGPVLEVPEALAHPQVEARDLLVKQDHPTAGPVSSVGSPMGFGRGTFSPLPPPRLGEHGESVLREIAGMSLEEVEAAKSDGALVVCA